MNTPFTTEQFMEVMGAYNLGIYPLQIIILLLGILALGLAHTNSIIKNNMVGMITGFLWLWMGAVYSFQYFSGINTAAPLFGSVFILQGLMILWETFKTGRLEIHMSRDLRGYTGEFLMIFGILLYPFIGYLTGTPVSNTISLGLPCPTTIFTFGIFLLSSGKFPKYLLIIPLLWALTGTTAAIKFCVVQDFMLIISGTLASFFLLSRRKNLAF